MRSAAAPSRAVQRDAETATSRTVPAITIFLSWIFLGEVPTVLGLVGGALCLGGVALSRRSPKSPSMTRPPPGGQHGSGSLIHFGVTVLESRTCRVAAFNYSST
jgi:hypothetical protein